MAQDQMTQAEIDALLSNITEGEPFGVDMSLLVSNEEEMKKWRHCIKSAVARYHWAMENDSFDRINEARHYLHQCAFSLWLYNHGFHNRDDFCRTMNREAIKRGMKPLYKAYSF